ncbi:uncharacterized protein BCR38DRAFT_423966 [Pseudomassariella vexata]|uniref:Uncharacterized protein n=1 Tax=Pseudomassariella vexata TaxID=1141098 RepID=A0A1Y2EAS0_9PEZI|nr:uncharacterized protein BCR38DRAFT_423966 [Pseudomassariella vexata]ORY68661.1 hypothetical protein BCR38DRAFT_423966 [Pseudomassariella vexata]
MRSFLTQCLVFRPGDGESGKKNVVSREAARAGGRDLAASCALRLVHHDGRPGREIVDLESRDWWKGNWIFVIRTLLETRTRGGDRANPEHCARLRDACIPQLEREVRTPGNFRPVLHWAHGKGTRFISNLRHSYGMWSDCCCGRTYPPESSVCL